MQCGRRQAHLGPSPRVRGERSLKALCSRGRSGHPRACGENQQDQQQPYAPSGPSPRVRGELIAPIPTLIIGLGPSPRVRGELAAMGSPCRLRSGHPRACGENGDCSSKDDLMIRAIPARAGRTPRPGDYRQAADRAIPARAGRTGKGRGRETFLCGPSPPVRGERHGAMVAARRVYGPSPRVRGERAPAARWMPRSSGHPRACGENTSETLGFQRFEGPEVSSDCSSMVAWEDVVKRSMASFQAASLTAIKGRPSRSMSWASINPCTRRA